MSTETLQFYTTLSDFFGKKREELGNLSKFPKQKSKSSASDLTRAQTLTLKRELPLSSLNFS